MYKKKLMLLGGIHYLLPVIEIAHNHGFHVITVDYLPNNIAHKYSDEYHNVSILDKNSVLALAKKLQINGILSYAVDPGVVTAAYVAENMGLPFSCSYKTASILQDKSLFRKFLIDNGFNAPHAKGYKNAKDVHEDLNFFNWPVIVKPVDSAGSKGVTRVEEPDELETAITHALNESHSAHFIIEDYLEKEGLSSGSECFYIDGELRYNAFYDQYFDWKARNPYTPSAECWPADKPKYILEEVKSQLQKLGTLLHFRTGIFNVEWRVCNGKVYLMEVSPRAGGNRLAEILNYATDVNIIEAEVCKAINGPMPVVHEPNYKGYYCILILHSEKAGLFNGIEVKENYKKAIIETELRVNFGDTIESFSGANNAIGTLFMKFNSRHEMDEALLHQQDWLKVKVK